MDVSHPTNIYNDAVLDLLSYRSVYLACIDLHLLKSTWLESVMQVP